jgi:hypothetical protein
VIEAITHREGKRPDVVVTGARLAGAVTSYQTLRARMTAPDASQAPVLIVLGTGWGLTSEVVDAADIRLAPIDGVDGYNHLSVRSAAAIILDRLLGEREDSDAGSRPAERRGFR